MLYGDLQTAIKAYSNGENVTSCLKKQFGTSGNTPEIIEIAHDLQAGSYIEYVRNNRNLWHDYTMEFAKIIGAYSGEGDSVLDVGTGEMTTLAGVAHHCYSGKSDYFACDISWSRLQKGREFIKTELKHEIGSRLQPFVASMFHLPFSDRSLDIVWTSHALEPNGGREKEALSELLRVTRKKLILFEPYYEENSSEGKRRMTRLGYVKGIPNVVEELGAACDDIIPISNISKALNPTYAFIVSPQPAEASNNGLWACPATRLPMERMNDCFWSNHSMLAYPILKGIPILRPEAAILASSIT